MKKIMLFFSLCMLLVLTACGNETSKDSIEVIKFADAGWDSIRLHNSIAQTIIEEGYGYETEVTSGTTAATMQSLEKGDINVYMEVWTDNIKDVYEKAIESGNIMKVATNFADNAQGLYVPTYVIEGDAERGIEPIAPDLKTVQDLEKYPEIFQDPEDSSKGRVVGAPSSWVVSEYLGTKLETYGLDEQYNYLAPGSDSAIVADLAGAYKKGEPWVGYYWSPTWVTASYDLTLLEDAPYDEAKWNESKGTEFPPNDVVIAVHKDLPTQAKDVVDFLSKYETSNDLTESALDYMQENDVEADEAAIWWMKEYEDIWTAWVSEEVAEKVKASLK
ncbi:MULTISPECIES: ABC transporter substrate-binding protein [Psychrobacillus]|uniref:ABC transporter substrate-binding protein n=1 Tax=Psychrobacillus faecigallinarum TaxID=2762235 RepID=A0ABR8RAE7_9BACI|nr:MULTISPECIES: ABC transporter substrate-binding protein [Psychrobacillus]MBD7944660.1 ABC transporter substrate-binding protein [Psychrobacillus faecigallinarum]QEY21182.1 ABC transporter substrate-binding protein [Psychrobacillus sp. AK 1817]QGM31691.1 ABC transporter substrate-binding protein [Bacillus sp. N3536]